ncbi:unnamed protein product [Adineta ricciae]|uniref:Peptidase S8/S53 domain-containing protein n=1 Tax=Adineta ricciae TaxID=249248 RepID=A0A815VV77_ADIRI|nr:unnamed protein product [Adineta ricciae]
MMMQVAAIFALLLIIPLTIYGQSPLNGGQIIVKNQDLSNGLLNPNGGAAAILSSAPQPKDQIGKRRRKRQAILVHQPQIHSTLRELFDSPNDKTDVDVHILFREHQPFPDHYSTFDNFSQYLSALNTHREPTNAERRQKLINDYGAEILNEFWLTNSMFVKMPLEHARRYAQEQEQHYILLHPGHEQGGVWGLQDLGVARQAVGSDWLYNAQASLNNLQGCIAVIDSGVRKTHTVFNSPNRINLTLDCIYGGSSCADASINPTQYDVDDDCLSHGTTVASIISANSNAGDSLHGMSPACINSYKVVQTSHSAGTSTCTTYLNSTWIVTAIQAALANGDRIINLSLYTNCLNQSLCDVTHAVDAAHDLGAIIFVASGNDATQGQQKAPAHSSKVLTIGAVDLLNLTHTATYQASGPTSDGRIKPDLQAPSGLCTAYNGCGGIGNWCPTNNNGSNNGFWTVDGTSVSTPIVTGAAYLLKKQLISYGATNPEPGLIYSWILSLTNGPQVTNTTGAGLLSLGWRQCTFMWQTLYANQYIVNNFDIDSASDSYGSKRMDVAIWWPEDSKQTVRHQVSLKLTSPQGILLAQTNAPQQVWQKITYIQPGNTRLPSGTYQIRIDVGTLQPAANYIRVFLTACTRPE